MSGITGSSIAQEKPRFWDDVQTIKHYDQMYTPPAHPILFTGSSSIRKWSSLEKDFPEHTVLNRGVGGTIVNDMIFYANDIIFPYHPRQIVLYVGDNDVPDGQTTADSILQRTKRLFSVIRAKLPEVPIVYIAIKPSPSRAQFMEKALAANKLIAAFLETDPHAVFVDIYHPMLDEAGQPRPELFLSDMLHMNEKGYAIWREAIAPHLLPAN
ncbi:SGNH/GDSL hydrolase family protein [Chitinophaga japonensis]